MEIHRKRKSFADSEQDVTTPRLHDRIVTLRHNSQRNGTILVTVIKRKAINIKYYLLNFALIIQYLNQVHLTPHYIYTLSLHKTLNYTNFNQRFKHSNISKSSEYNEKLVTPYTARHTSAGSRFTLG